MKWCWMMIILKLVSFYTTTDHICDPPHFWSSTFLIPHLGHFLILPHFFYHTHLWSYTFFDHTFRSFSILMGWTGCQALAYGGAGYLPSLISLLWTCSLSVIVLRHTWVDSEHVTGGFRARTNCERVSNIGVLKSVILVISVGNYRNKCRFTVQKTMDMCRKTLHEI